MKTDRLKFDEIAVQTIPPEKSLNPAHGRRLYYFACFIAICILFCLNSNSYGDALTIPIVKAGQHAPGTNARFNTDTSGSRARFGNNPRRKILGSNVSSEFKSSGNGHFVFSSFIYGKGVTDDNDWGIWAYSPKTGIRLIAREGTAVKGQTLPKGTSPNGTSMAWFDIDSQGRVAFGSQGRVAVGMYTFGVNSDIFAETDIGGPFRKVMVPVGEDISDPIYKNGRFLFLTNYTMNVGAGGFHLNGPRKIWIEDVNGINLVADLTKPLSGWEFHGAPWGWPGPLLITDIDAVNFCDAGKVAFIVRAVYRSPCLNGFRRIWGIFRGNAQGGTVVIDSHSPVPGSPNPAGFGWLEFEDEPSEDNIWDLRMSPDGRLAFYATVRSHQDIFYNFRDCYTSAEKSQMGDNERAYYVGYGIWAEDAGHFKLVVGENTRSNNSNGLISVDYINPLALVEFTDRSLIFYGRDVKIGTPASSSSTNPWTDYGIWVVNGVGSKPRMVAKMDQQAPGIWAGSKFSHFTAVGVMGKGKVVFAALLSWISDNKNVYDGIWAEDDECNLVLLGKNPGDVSMGITTEKTYPLSGIDTFSPAFDSTVFRITPQIDNSDCPKYFTYDMRKRHFLISTTLDEDKTNKRSRRSSSFTSANAPDSHFWLGSVNSSNNELALAFGDDKRLGSGNDWGQFFNFDNLASIRIKSFLRSLSFGILSLNLFLLTLTVL